ncbi:MAG TPA: hypothetical protein VKB19_19780 [Pedobacter sp.]|nr:hypothetical protein [Pedobacter sp.]
MSTKKPLVYVLGIAVCCIWGLVLHRVFAGHGDEADGNLPARTKGTTDKRTLPKQFPGNFSLLLNYPDPFTGEASRVADTAKTKMKRSAIIPAAIPQTPDPVEQMKYLGFVADGKGNKKVAIISYQKQEKMLKEGDTISEVKVIAIGKDAVMVSYKGKTRRLKTE